MDSRVDPITLAENVFAILSNGSFSATYKYGLLLALIDLCIEKVAIAQLPRDAVTITTHEIAERVVDLYWPQCVPWKNAEVLRQYNSRDRNAAIVSVVADFRKAVGFGISAVNEARRVEPMLYRKLLKDVERTLIKDPIPRLQYFGGKEERFLYEYAWSKEAIPHLAELDNILTLRPGVAEGLIGLNAVLRPIIQHGWLREVRRINGLEDAELEMFFFSRERESLEKVRLPLLQLQAERCFFCEAKVADQPQVDHFLPWARFPTNLVENLVVAHADCNGSKSDFLASGRHVINWTARAKTHQGVLEKIGTDYGLGSDGPRIVKVAAVIYGQLPDASLLWDGKKKFEPLDRDKVLKLFHAA